MKVDAFIVSEPGTLITVKQLLPEMKIHLGNVSNVYNYETANFWHNQGADRVVISRELSIKEIEMMRLKTPESLELEAYVHGPIVMSYSGRKLITSYLESKGKDDYSSKKRYNLAEEKRQGQYCPVYEDEAGTIFFASRDLCMIEYIDKFIRAGVSTLIANIIMFILFRMNANEILTYKYNLKINFEKIKELVEKSKNKDL